MSFLFLQQLIIPTTPPEGPLNNALLPINLYYSHKPPSDIINNNVGDYVIYYIFLRYYPNLFHPLTSMTESFPKDKFKIDNY